MMFPVCKVWRFRVLWIFVIKYFNIWFGQVYGKDLVKWILRKFILYFFVALFYFLCILEMYTYFLGFTWIEKEKLPAHSSGPAPAHGFGLLGQPDGRSGPRRWHGGCTPDRSPHLARAQWRGGRWQLGRQDVARAVARARVEDGKPTWQGEDDGGSPGMVAEGEEGEVGDDCDESADPGVLDDGLWWWSGPMARWSESEGGRGDLGLRLSRAVAELFMAPMLTHGAERKGSGAGLDALRKRRKGGPGG
jgi:hypothetical protein